MFKSEVYEGLTEEDFTYRMGLVERLRNRRRRLTRNQCRLVLANVGWDLVKVLEVIDVLSDRNTR